MGYSFGKSGGGIRTNIKERGAQREMRVSLSCHMIL